MQAAAADDGALGEVGIVEDGGVDALDDIRESRPLRTGIAEGVVDRSPTTD